MQLNSSATASGMGGFVRTGIAPVAREVSLEHRLVMLNVLMNVVMVLYGVGLVFLILG